MRTLLTVALVALLAARVFAQACDPGVPAIPPLARLGLHTWNNGFCDAGSDLNADHTFLDAHACTDTVPCGITESKDFTIENIAAGDDNFELFIARADLTLVKAACHCDLNCTTPATLQFEDRALHLIDMGGDLACDTGTGNSSFVNFLTSDSDRFLNAGEGFKFSTTNTPTASQRVTITVVYTIP